MLAGYFMFDCCRQVKKLLGLVMVLPALVFAVPTVWAVDLPQASFTVNKQTGSLLETFQFDASASTDSRGQKRGLRYLWQFGDGNTAEGMKVNHKYNDVGFYDVGLKIIETASGLFASTSMRLEVRPSLPPDLQVQVTPTQGTTSDSFTFRAQPFSFIGSTQDQLLVRFDFDGDGTFDTNFAKLKEVVHTYNREGLYTPIVEVKDLDGTTKRQIGYTVYRNGQRDPIQVGRVTVARGSTLLLQGSFTVTPTIAPVNTNFHFDASQSVSGSSSNLVYRWDFDGDGTFDTDWQAAATADYAYIYDGQKKVILQIKDRSGAIAKAERTVRVEKININPEVDFNIQVVGLTINQQAPVVIIDSEVRFTATLRDRDSQASDLTMRWDFDGDGTFETQFSKQRTVTYRYLTTGDKRVKLEVRDKDGGLSERVKPLTVIANKPPIAALTITPTKGTTSTVFKFDASKVSDTTTPAGQLKVRFDFNNDGTFETPFSGRKIETYTYSTTGTKEVLLQVIDREGSITIATATIEVLTNLPPQARLQVSQANGLLSTTFQFDASASLDGQSGSNKGLLYRWQLGEGSTVTPAAQFGNQSRLSTRYATPGTKTIIVEVKDKDGAVAVANQAIEIHWAAGYLAEANKLRVGLKGDDTMQIQALAQPSKRLDFLRLLLAASDQGSKLSLKEQQQLLQKQPLPFKDTASLPVADQMLLLTALQKGIISANPNFYGNRPLSRAEALKMIFKTYGLTPASEGANTFSDVAADLWPAVYIKQAVIIGLVRGYGDNTFRPFHMVRTDEALKLIFVGRGLAGQP